MAMYAKDDDEEDALSAVNCLYNSLINRVQHNRQCTDFSPVS